MYQQYQQTDLIGLSQDEALVMLQKVEASVGNLRRGIFQRHNDLLQMYLSAEDKNKLQDQQLAQLEASCQQIKEDIASVREEMQHLSSLISQLRYVMQYPLVENKISKILPFAKSL